MTDSDYRFLRTHMLANTTPPSSDDEDTVDGDPLGCSRYPGTSHPARVPQSARDLLALQSAEALRPERLEDFWFEDLCRRAGHDTTLDKTMRVAVLSSLCRRGTAA
jgi:hypothetical protein